MAQQYLAQADRSLTVSDFVIQTQMNHWVIPYNCEILKALVLEQNIRASDLRFKSASQCQCFIKRLFLLAAQDECRHRMPSKLATLARELVRYKAT